MDESLDVSEKWPELFGSLDEEQRHAVTQTFASSWHEGWMPDPEDVARLIDRVTGVLDHDEYVRQADAAVRQFVAAGYAGDAGHGHPEGDAAAVEFDSWESYFYLPPYHRTLRNLPDYRTPEALRLFEHIVGVEQEALLRTMPPTPERTFDARQVCAIHRQLFGEVYAWAGQYRTQNIRKAGSDRSFASVGGGIDRYLAEMHRIVERTEWAQLDHEGFGWAAAEVFVHLNQAHPFREGNGRTAKIFLEQVAQLSPFRLQWHRLGYRRWNESSALSQPGVGTSAVRPDAMVTVFLDAAVPRLERGSAADVAEGRRRLP